MALRCHVYVTTIKMKIIYILVDGYHRYTVLKTSQRIYKRENGLLPIVVIDKDLSNRMSSTIRHNRARGMHNIELMCNIVAELRQGRYVRSMDNEKYWYGP